MDSYKIIQIFKAHYPILWERKYGAEVIGIEAAVQIAIREGYRRRVHICDSRAALKAV